MAPAASEMASGMQPPSNSLRASTKCCKLRASSCPRCSFSKPYVRLLTLLLLPQNLQTPSEVAKGKSELKDTTEDYGKGLVSEKADFKKFENLLDQKLIGERAGL